MTATKERRANSKMDTKTYKVVGVSTSPQGETKIRFAQDLVIQNQNLGDEKTHQHRAERDTMQPMSKEASIAVDDHSGRFQQARSEIAGRWFREKKLSISCKN
jgi:hypothetical protein